MGVILLGDKTAAARWLAYAKSRAASLAKQGNNLSQTFSPAEGVTIRVQTLQGTPRVWIEAGGLLVFTAGFEDDKLVVNMAADYDRTFSTKLTIPPEPPPFNTQGPFVDRFQNLGEGQGIFVEGANSGFSRVYVVNNSPPATAKVIAILHNIPIGSRTLTYIGKYDGQKRIISMFNENSQPDEPRLTIFAADSQIIGQGTFPLAHGTLPNTTVEPVWFLGNKTAIALVRFFNVGETIEEYIMARSTDGGFNWTPSGADGLSLLMNNHGDWPKLRMVALTGGKALAIGLGDPTFGTGPDKLLSFTSFDRGASFNTITTITPDVTGHPYFDPVSIGDGAAALVGNDGSGNAIIYRTQDSGASWQNLGPVAPGVALVSRVGNVTAFSKKVLGMVVAGGGEMHLYISKDFGETWQPGQKIATAPIKTHFNRVLRIGSKSRPLLPDPTNPDLYENAT